MSTQHHPTTENVDIRDATFAKTEEVAFDYGVGTEFDGVNWTCTLTVELDEDGQKYYQGFIYGNALLHRDLSGIKWKVVGPDEEQIATDVTDSRGRFTIPWNEGLARQRALCYFVIPGRRTKVKRTYEGKSGEGHTIPNATWHWSPDSFAGKMAAAGENSEKWKRGGPLNLVGDELFAVLPAAQVPFGAICVVALDRDKPSTSATKVILMPLTDSTDPPCRENSLLAESLIGDVSSDTLEFDAWALTDDPATHRGVSLDDLRALAKSCSDDRRFQEPRELLLSLIKILERQAAHG